MVNIYPAGDCPQLSRPHNYHHHYRSVIFTPVFQSYLLKTSFLWKNEKKNFIPPLDVPQCHIPFLICHFFPLFFVLSNFQTRPCLQVMDCNSLSVISGVTGNLEYARWDPGLPNEPLQTHIWAQTQIHLLLIQLTKCPITQLLKGPMRNTALNTNPPLNPNLGYVILHRLLGNSPPRVQH